MKGPRCNHLMAIACISPSCMRCANSGISNTRMAAVRLLRHSSHLTCSSLQPTWAQPHLLFHGKPNASLATSREQLRTSRSKPRALRSRYMFVAPRAVRCGPLP